MHAMCDFLKKLKIMSGITRNHDSCTACDSSEGANDPKIRC